MPAKPAEFVFILPDGSVRYEMVYERREAIEFARMHRALEAMPLAMYERQSLAGARVRKTARSQVVAPNS